MGQWKERGVDVADGESDKGDAGQGSKIMVSHILHGLPANHHFSLQSYQRRQSLQRSRWTRQHEPGEGDRKVPAGLPQRGGGEIGEVKGSGRVVGSGNGGDAAVWIYDGRGSKSARMRP